MQKSITRLWFALCAMVAVAGFYGCSEKDDEPPVVTEEKLDVAAEYRTYELDRTSAKFEIPVETNLAFDQWRVDQTERWFAATKKRVDDQHSAVSVTVYENTTGAKRTAKITVSSESKRITRTITITQYGNNEVVVDEDSRVRPSDARASEQQDDNQSISKTLDGDFASHFHSRWNGTRFPVTLEYFFKGDQVIDYLIYYTRNGNGNFGKLSISVATDAARTYEKIGDYDFHEKGTPSVVQIPVGLKPTAIKFSVESGLGGFASCAEMEFYRSNTAKTLETKLLTVFTDATCTELKPNVTDEQIEALGDYFGRVARAIRDNSYDPYEKEFRIRSYEAYSNNVEWRDKLMTRTYSDLDNPTGIAVKPGDEVIVCVGDTHGKDVSIQCIPEELVRHSDGDYVQPAAQGDSYILREGVNKIKIKNDGQLFVMYNTDILSPDAKPIKIHIPLGSGTVTGFFDLKEHKTDERYAELLRKATHKYFCVRGNTFMFYFHRNKMPNKILGAINLWDNIGQWEQELCGIDEYRGEGKPFNNHLFGMSPEANNHQMFLWASDYRMAFIYTVLHEILVDANTILATPNPIWGPAHEMGHVHQQAINWDPSTETSANLFAHYVQEKLGKYTSHGPGLQSLAQLRADCEASWYDIAQCPSEYKAVNNRMWWQLYIYYHRLGVKPDFWKGVFNEMRELHMEHNEEAGRKQLEFAKACCRVAGEDLSEFFDLWGFFVPYSKTYGSTRCVVTRTMADEARRYMEQFPKPKQPLQYIEDRKAVGYKDGDFNRAEIGDLGFFETYQANPKLSADISAKISGRNVTVSNGNEAVMLEVRKGGETGPILYFSNFLKFTVPSNVNISGCSLYAVQADGKRVMLGNF